MPKPNNFFRAVAVLISTIIGAGIFGLPYVIYQAGFLTGVLLLIALTIVVVLTHLYIGEIALSTEKIHQLTGYAEKYLGIKGKYLMFGAVIFGFYGALLSYLIGEGNALAALFGGNAVIYSIIFFFVAGFLVWRGMTLVKEADFFITFLIFIIVFIIAIIAAPALNFDNLAVFDLSKILIPYGVILFALGGASAIPQLREILINQKAKIKKTIIIGTIIPFIVYLLFTFIVIGVSGPNITELATVGLGEIIGKSMIVFGNLFALCAMATSFLTIGMALKSTYVYDFKIKPNVAWLLVVFPPLILFFLGLNDFVKVMGLAGSIGLGLEGLLIMAILPKLAKLRDRKPEYSMPKNPLILGILSLIFIGGIIYALYFL